MADLKTTKEERARWRRLVASWSEDAATLGDDALDDLDTLEAENAALKAALDGVAMARVTEYGVELSRELLSTIYALTEEP